MKANERIVSRVLWTRRVVSQVRRGFTLIEVIVVVAVIAILAAILSPNLVKHIQDSKVSRALGDIKVIGAAMGDFNKDLGTWPFLIDGGLPMTPDNILYLLCGVGNDPAAEGPDTVFWNRSGGWPAEKIGRLEEHLIYNQPPANTYDPSRWNGPYLQRIGPDPWGNHYSVNVAYLSDFFPEGNVVYVLSAGPDTIWQTDAIQLNGPSAGVGGDDIPFRIR